MDIKCYRTIELHADFANDHLEGLPVILSANDHDGRIIRFSLTDDGTNVSVGSMGARLLFNAAIYDPNSSGGWVTMSPVYEADTATWEVPVPSDALVPGEVAMAIAVYQGDNQVCTRNFMARVEAQILNDNAPEAKNALNEFYEAINRVDTAADDAEQAVTNANTALATANQTIEKVQADTADAIDAAAVATSKAENAAEDAAEAMQGITAATVLRAGNYLAGEAEGPLAHVEDAWPSPVGELRVLGRSEQASTTGKNLLHGPDHALPYTSNGITWEDNGDGGIKVSGTATNNSYLTYYTGGGSVRTGIPLDAGTYTIASNTQGVLCAVGTFEADGSEGSIPGVPAGATVTFSVANPISARVTLYVVKDTAINAVMYPQLELGSAATPWEPYTGGKPSPNPDYPQAIESVECGEVVCAGRNFLDAASLLIASGYQGAKVADLDCFVSSVDSVSADGRAWGYNSSDYKLYLPGGKYTLVIETKEPSLNKSKGFQVFRKDGLQVFNIPQNILFTSTGTASYNFTLSKSDTYGIVFKLYDGIVRPAIYEQDAVPESYMPYTGSAYPLTMPDGSPVTLRSLPDGTRDEVRWTDDGGRELVRRVGHAVFDGSADEGWRMATVSAYNTHEYYTNILEGKVAPPKSNNGIVPAYCTSFAVVSANNTYMGVIGLSFQRAGTDDRVDQVYINDGTRDVSAFKSRLAENPIELDYPMVTPEVIPLASAAAPRLPESTSNVWATSESGVQPDVALTYQVDVNIEHERQNKRISDLEAVVNGLAANALEV
jgi:hypothetical protein